MGRLIDADVFVENIVSIADLRTISTKTIGEALDKTPTVDAVPVVRCKDCRYWNDAPANDGFNSCEMDALIRHEGFFCANGERKDDDGNG